MHGGEEVVHLVGCGDCLSAGTKAGPCHMGQQALTPSSDVTVSGGLPPPEQGCRTRNMLCSTEGVSTH